MVLAATCRARGLEDRAVIEAGFLPRVPCAEGREENAVVLVVPRQLPKAQVD